MDFNTTQVTRLMMIVGASILMFFAFPTEAPACSLNAAGSCGGSACPDGKVCTKTGDFECGCVEESAARSDCGPYQKLCQISDTEWTCWPKSEGCPSQLGAAQENSALHVVFSTHGAPEGSRATQEVTLSVSGCGGCFNSQRVPLPGNVQGVAPVESHFRGAVNSSGIYWLGDTVWEKACFGTPTERCGSVHRTYLINHQ